jgi:hypothetical protein
MGGVVSRRGARATASEASGSEAGTGGETATDSEGDGGTGGQDGDSTGSGSGVGAGMTQDEIDAVTGPGVATQSEGDGEGGGGSDDSGSNGGGGDGVGGMTQGEIDAVTGPGVASASDAEDLVDIVGSETGSGLVGGALGGISLGGIGVGGGGISIGGGFGAATPPIAVFGSAPPHTLGSDVWVYQWQHTPLFDDDNNGVLDPFVWSANPGEVPESDPDDPDTCPGLYEVLTHDVYDGYTVYLMADITIPGGTTAAGGADLAAGFASIVIDGRWPKVSSLDYDGDTIGDDADDDLDGDGVPNSVISDAGYIQSLDTHMDGARTLSQDFSYPAISGTSGYNAGEGDTQGRFFAIRVNQPDVHITLQNMNCAARVAETMVWVKPATADTHTGSGVGTVVTYKNVAYAGPQLIYNIDGEAVLRNVNFTMTGSDAAAFGGKQEVAQLCKGDFWGYFNVIHDTNNGADHHVFRFNPRTTYYHSATAQDGDYGNYALTFHYNAKVCIESVHESLLWFNITRTGLGANVFSRGNLDIYMDEESSLTYRAVDGFTSDTSNYDTEIGHFTMEQNSRLDVKVTGAALNDEHPGFQLKYKAVVRQGAEYDWESSIPYNLDRYADDNRSLLGENGGGDGNINSDHSYEYGDWTVDGGVVRVTMTGSFGPGHTYEKFIVRTHGFTVQNGGKFFVNHTDGIFDQNSACVEFGEGGLTVVGEGSEFGCGMRNQNSGGYGIQSHGNVYVGPGANFSYQIQQDPLHPYTPDVKSVMRFMGSTSALVVDDPQSFVLASVAGRIIEYNDSDHTLSISGEQVNFWTSLPSVPEPPLFPARPAEHYMNLQTDYANPAQPELGRRAVSLSGTLKDDTAAADGWTISSIYYNGTSPASINTAVFANQFNTIRAISAGRMKLTTQPYYADAGLPLTGETLDGASVHAILDPYNPNTDDYNNTPYMAIADDITGEFSMDVGGIHSGDTFWVLASKNFLFIESWRVAQYAPLPMVVYIDGTLPATLPDGSDPDGEGRGGTPSDPVRTMKRAMEILRLSGGHVLYVCGTVTVGADTAIAGAGSGGGATVTYTSGADTVVLKGPYDIMADDYEGVETLEIRRFVTPTAGFAIVGGSANPDYDADYDVPDFTGVMFDVSPAAVRFSLDHVIMDGSHEETVGEYFCHTVYEIDDNGDWVLDGGGDPVPSGTYPIPMANTAVQGRNPAAQAAMVGAAGEIYLTPPVTLRNNYNTYTGNVFAQMGGALCLTGAGKATSVAGAAGLSTEIYGNTYLGAYNGYGGAAICGTSGNAVITLAQALIHHNTATMHGGAVHSLGAATVGGGSVFYSNTTVNGFGGALANNHTNATLSMTDTKLYANSAPSNGGALFSNGTVNLTGSSAAHTEIYQNTAPSGGAGVFNVGAMTVAYAHIHDNDSTASSSVGGGIYNTGSLTINDGEYDHNASSTEGGFLCVRNPAPCSATINGGMFHHNQARSGMGGAISNRGTLALNGGEFYENLAGSGAAIANNGTGVMDGGSYHDNGTASTSGGAVYNLGTFTYKKGGVAGNLARYGKFLYQFGTMYLDCPNPTATGYVGPDQDVFLVTSVSGGGSYTDYIIQAKQLLTGGALKVTVSGRAGRAVIDYDDAIPGVTTTGTTAQIPYYNLAVTGNDFYVLMERAADISVLELNQVYPAFPVVYVDGTLPTVLGDGSDPDGAGRGGTPQAPVRTLRRAFEILKAAQPYVVPIPSGAVTHPDNAIETGGGGALETDTQWANTIYILGTVTLERNTEIDTVSSGGQTHAYYLDAAMTAASIPRIELGAPTVHIRRYGKPLTGFATYGDYDARWNVASFLGDLICVGDAPVGDTSQPRSQVTLRLGKGVDLDGRYPVGTVENAAATYKDGIYWKVGWKRTHVDTELKAHGVLLDVRYDGKFISGKDILAYPSAYTEADADSARLHGNYVDVTAADANMPYGSAVRSRGVVHQNSGVIEGNYTGGDLGYTSAQAGYGAGVCSLGTGEASINGLVQGNLATYGGGVAQVGGGQTLYVDSGVQVTGNTALQGGGGVYVAGTGSVMYMQKGRILSNTSLRRGGGAYVGPGGYLNTGGFNSMVSINSNTAGQGGGVYIEGGTFHMDTAMMALNLAQYPTAGAGVPQGGGVYNNGTFNFENGIIDFCETQRDLGGGTYDNYGMGGGIYNTNSASYTGVFNAGAGANITNCHATLGGGIYVYDGTADASASGAYLLVSGCEARGVTGSAAGLAAYGDFDGAGDGDGGGVYVFQGNLKLSAGSILANTAYGDGGGIYSAYGPAGAAVTLTGGSVSGNMAFGRGGGVYIGCGILGGVGRSSVVDLYATTISGNSSSAMLGDGVYQDGIFNVHNATHSLSGSSVYLCRGRTITQGASTYTVGDRVINRQALAASGLMYVDIENPYKGRDVVVYDAGVVVAPGVDSQHVYYALGYTVPAYLFLVQDAGASNVLELQNWQVFDVSLSQEYFLVIKNETSGNTLFSVPIHGANTDEGAASADANTNLISPKFKVVNGGAFAVKVEIVGFVNKNTEAGVNTALFPNINLVSSSTTALLPGAADNDLYLGVKGTTAAGNAFGALTATSLHNLGTVGAVAVNLGSIPAPTAPVPAPFGEFEFTGAAGDGFMEKYKDPGFPLTAAATAKKDYLRTVNAGLANTAVNARAKWQLYFRLRRP